VAYRGLGKYLPEERVDHIWSIYIKTGKIRGVGYVGRKKELYNYQNFYEKLLDK